MVATLESTGAWTGTLYPLLGCVGPSLNEISTVSEMLSAREDDVLEGSGRLLSIERLQQCKAEV